MSNSERMSDINAYNEYDTSDAESEAQDFGTNVNSNLLETLSKWAIHYNIQHNALSDLLKILDSFFPQKNIPKDSRTLLKTPLCVENVKVVAPGNYCHIGFAEALNCIVSEYEENNIHLNKLDILINIDGSPISNSSKSCLWPILCSDAELKDVFIIGLYHGYEKPNDCNVFLESFVNEASEVIKEGYYVGNKFVPNSIHALICDAPAKSFVVSIKGHTGYSSCSKCKIEGKI